MIQKFIILSIFFTIPSVFTSCGSSPNVFQPLAPGSGKDGARSAFSRGDYDSAITKLEDHLKDHPGDAEALSMLATARMKKAGLDQLEIAAKITEVQTDQGKSEWQSLLSAMPAGLSENIQQLSKAVTSLSQIPIEQRTAEQNYQLGVAQAALAITVTKKVVGDSSGTSIDKNKVDTLSDADAQLILTSINSSGESITSSGTTSKGASSISSLTTKIASSPGDSDAEKLRNFLKTT